MAKNDSMVTDNPKLKQKILSDGQISLYLEYYFGYAKSYSNEKEKETVKINRKKEFINLYIWASPRTPIERQHNKETLELAKQIRSEWEQQLKADKTGMRIKSSLQKVNFLDFFQSYINNYTKRDIRVLKLAFANFKSYLSENYPAYEKSIKPEQITKEMVSGFLEFLQSRSKGEGAHTLFKRFKKVVKYAEEKEIIVRDPCKGIVCKVDDQTLKKDVLSTDEVIKLINTSYEKQNPEIRRAFIFCLYTGIRFCDVIELKYRNLDYSNRLLKFEQEKTKGHSSASGVVIPLNEGLLSLIGNSDDKDEVIFKLPSHTMCLKVLRNWSKKAGITKHITWHCARHSFAVNILNAGANIKTVASLLGHSGLKNTEKYTRAVDDLKRAAIDSLPELKLQD